jgi:hypothetical protein
MIFRTLILCILIGFSWLFRWQLPSIHREKLKILKVLKTQIIIWAKYAVQNWKKMSGQTYYCPSSKQIFYFICIAYLKRLDTFVVAVTGLCPRSRKVLSVPSSVSFPLCCSRISWLCDYSKVQQQWHKPTFFLWLLSYIILACFKMYEIYRVIKKSLCIWW